MARAITTADTAPDATSGQRRTHNDTSTTTPAGTRSSATTRTPTGCSSTACDRPASTAGPRARAAGRGAIASRSSTPPPRRGWPAFAPACAASRTRRPWPPIPWVEKIRRACVYLSNVDGHPALATLAARLGGSPYHLQRNFKRLVGVSPREYAEACRLGKVKRGLRQPGDITGAMFDAGYGSSSRFYERAVPKLGMAPSVYRRGGAGMSIQYTIVDSSNDALGRLLVAATPRGVCAVAMGASDADLTRALAREYPAATIAADAGALAGSANAIVAHLAGRRAAAGSAARRAGDRVPVAGMAGACGHSLRRDAHLQRGRGVDRAPARGPRRRACLRDQPGRARHSMSSGGAGGRGDRRLPLGRRAEEGAARDRAAA